MVTTLKAPLKARENVNIKNKIFCKIEGDTGSGKGSVPAETLKNKTENNVKQLKNI